MNNTKYLTSNDFILRKFAKDHTEKNDLHKFKIIEYSNRIPNEFEFVIQLDLSHQNLNEIPLKTLYCKALFCNYNKLITLPNIPYCEKLSCSNNKLSDLPDLSYCKFLYCSYNRLIKLPDLPYCEALYCYNNELIKLPDLPNCKELYWIIIKLIIFRI